MTGYHGPVPGIEIWPASPEFCDPQFAYKSYQRYIGMVDKAEELDFDWVSVSRASLCSLPNDAKSTDHGIGHCSANKEVRVALLGPLVPLNNPVQLAEEIAMFDSMSGGRLEVLFLCGTPNEHNT